MPFDAIPQPSRPDHAICWQCSGEGKTTCPHCFGHRLFPRNILGCPRCGKSGQVMCSNCHGTGYVSLEITSTQHRTSIKIKPTPLGEQTQKVTSQFFCEAINRGCTQEELDLLLDLASLIHPKQSSQFQVDFVLNSTPDIFAAAVATLYQRSQTLYLSNKTVDKFEAQRMFDFLKQLSKLMKDHGDRQFDASHQRNSNDNQ